MLENDARGDKEKIMSFLSESKINRMPRRQHLNQILCLAAADSLNVGPDPWNKTYYPKGAHADNSKKPWFIIDAEGQTLGRLAVLAANKIR